MSRHILERDRPRIEKHQLTIRAAPTRKWRDGSRPVGHPLVLAPPPPGPPRTRVGAPSATTDLWTTYHETPTRPARDRLLIHCTPLVRAVAHRIAAGLPASVEVADLVQVGYFGLLAAIDRFDPQRGLQFESYAAQRVRGAILDELRAQDWVPRAVRGRVRDRDQARERLEGRHCRAVTDEEVAAELGVAVAEMRDHRRPVQVLSTEALHEQGDGIAELMQADTGDGVDPAGVIESRETIALLRLAVLRLEERDQLVIRMYYAENRTLADIGRTLGLTESRVCQLHSRAILRLRGRFDELL